MVFVVRIDKVDHGNYYSFKYNLIPKVIIRYKNKLNKDVLVL